MVAIIRLLNSTNISGSIVKSIINATPQEEITHSMVRWMGRPEAEGVVCEWNHWLNVCHFTMVLTSNICKVSMKLQASLFQMVVESCIYVKY